MQSLGVLGFYAVGVLALGKILRSELQEIVRSALYKDPDFVDSLLKLCEDIFAARFLQLFAVEEDLHDELRDIFRNMQRLYRYTTKAKNE